VSRLVEDRPFSFRQRGDGSVEILWNNRPATVLAGKPAERFLGAAPQADEAELQLLMAKATGNFKRGNERRR